VRAQLKRDLGAEAIFRQDAISLRTPKSRILPRVIGGPAGCLGLDAIEPLYHGAG
jgi:hypothetical protein